MHDGTAAMLRPENAILLLRHAVNIEALGIGLELGNLFRDLFRKKQLPGMRYMTARISIGGHCTADVNLQMDVDRAPYVPTGIDRRELDDASLICEVHTA
jgi:hypothetical protein